MGDEKSAEKANPEAEPRGDASEPYWTPERMRAAKPLPLPHPDAAPPEAPATSEGAPSVSGAGSPGGGSVPPEDETLPAPAPEGSAKP